MSDGDVDAGLDSTADLAMFSRIMLWGLAAVVVVAAVAFLVTRNSALIGVLVVAYLVIAASQWYAVSRRTRVGRP